jgi:hypothetical protein
MIEKENENEKKNNDRRYFIASLFIVVLSLAVGYAVFAETLNISGTAQTTGTFDVSSLVLLMWLLELLTP